MQHLSDVPNQRCLLGGDSLPMHLALATRTRWVALFTRTSSWEIYDYGIKKEVVSPVVEEFFYKRAYDKRTTTAISADEVEVAVLMQLEVTVPAMIETAT
jgi:ADP-heptose:LPS heptosyltransferase